MVDIRLSLLLLLKVLLMFIIFFIFIPSRIVKFKREDSSFLDVIFISFIHFNLLTIIIVHLLSFLKIYDFFSIVFCYIAAYFIVLKINSKSKTKITSEIASNVMVNLFEFVDNESHYYDRFMNWIKIEREKLKDALKEVLLSIKSNPLKYLIIVFVLSSAFYIRFAHSLTHFYLGESDCYVHLAWSKYMGSNSMYQDGIYPYGYEAVISALTKLSFMDSYTIIRFLGPIQGMLIILSIYFILKKYNKKGTILIWTALLVYVLGSGLPVDISRQIAALPEEYASIFLLPGLYYFNRYLNIKDKSYLFLAAECLCLTLIIHPYVTVFLVICYGITFLVNISFIKDFKAFLYMVLTMVLASLIGVLPLFIGMLKGIPFHSSLNYIKSTAKMPNANINIHFSEQNKILLIFLILAMLVIILGFIYIIKSKNSQEKQYIKSDIIIIMISLILYLLYKAPSFNLPVLMDINRIGIFLSMFAVIVFGIFIKLMCLGIKNNKVNIGIQFLCFLFVVFSIYNYGKISLPVPNQYEYDDAAYAYLNIKKDYPAYNWTIVSPVEQYQECMGYGWHYNLYQFVLELEDNEKKEITIPTDYVFIFVEKYPLGTTNKITLGDSLKPVPKITGELSKYYSDKDSRRILEAKTYYYLESYREKNDKMEIYYDSNYMRIYRLTQDGNKPLNLKQTVKR